MENTTTSKVLVTGASSYLGSHIIKLLLERNYKVRGTVRSLANKDNYSFLHNIVPEKQDNLELVEANLDDKSCWPTVISGCQYIFHVANPVPSAEQKSEEEFVRPAVNGIRSILQAALDNGVNKIVLTSSSGTMYREKEDKILTEDDWGDEDDCAPYPKSKIKAEKAAWEFYEKNKEKIQLAVVNPSYVLGPVLHDKVKSTTMFVSSVLSGDSPGVFDLSLVVVDVRDVAETHYRAMFQEVANGRRYICSARTVSWEEVVSVLKKEFGKYGYQVEDKKLTKEEAEASGSILGFVLLPLWGKKLRLNNERSVKELNIKYRPIEETLIDTGYSLIKHGALPDKTQGK